MGFQQPRQHGRDFLDPVRRPRDAGDLGDVARIADGDAAQRLDALGDHVDQFELLAGVLVEEQVQLVEGRAAHQPVMLLVQRIQNLSVGQRLIEKLAREHPRVVRQREGELPHGAELLELGPFLVQPWLAGH